ncbi:DUF1997 domain-containing protein [Calothrix sp. 336/3]|uniref:DUF1997 domain-containing protein n=1 Tax=Calothrix sp. 336/3 TaxID=1337936 RepID=UPI0004E29FD4|nr:DUF1997 domain-containing protein [Calothrix sp. 336/3]AKG23165.1 hypothetical protein IJ00_19485 [Calothrix sp. 336/3]
MLARKPEYQSLESNEVIFSVVSGIQEVETTSQEVTPEEPIQFSGHYADCMEMYAPAGTVAEYLNSHGVWFSRCAEPMKVEPLGEHGYALVIGRFGSFGYEVEPKIGLELLPPQAGVYRIQTIPIPGYQPPGYDVDYQAVLQLSENQDNSTGILGEFTRVEWELDLKVYIQFPRFIQRLPKSLIQSTGDRLLNQIVRQVSRRLTRKVQADFHQSFGIPVPKKYKKW